jgi:hypothetical protein
VEALCDPHEMIEKEQVVFVSEEARLTIVSALNDVHGNGKQANRQTGKPANRQTGDRP